MTPSRVGQVFLFERSWALVVSGPSLPRRKGSTVGAEGKVGDPDCLVHTLCVFAPTGLHYPVERTEASVAAWEGRGRSFPS